MPIIELVEATEADADAGFSYQSSASLLAIPPPSLPPSPIQRREMHGHSFTMPTNPALDQFGRPDSATYVPSSMEENVWGGLQIVVGGVDVTYYRSIPTQVTGWSYAEPFADSAAQIVFPQISPMEALPSWLDEYAEVEIVCDATGEIVWEGLAEEPGWGDKGIGITCIGVLHQADLYVRAPGYSDAALPIHILLRDYAFNKTYRPGYRFPTLAIEDGTEVQSRYRGSWESPLAYADKLLKQAITADQQFSIELVRPRAPILRERDETTQHWTLYYGAPGVECDLKTSWRRPNVIYGTGQSQSGAEWRGTFLDPEFGGPRTQPLAYDEAVHGYDEVGDGTLSLDEARRDSGLIRIEEFHSFGQGITRAQAKGIAEDYRLRQVDVGYTGTIRLESDPCAGSLSGSRFKMRQNQNVLLRNFNGITEGLLLHVSGVDVDWGSGTVTLTVDSKARDRDTVEALGTHEPEAYDPWLATQDGKASNVINDSVAPWDSDGGSGYFPSDITNGFFYIDPAAFIPVTGRTWTVFGFLASERDTISTTEVTVTAAAQFGFYLFNRVPNMGQLPALPLAEGAWDNRTKPDGLVAGWGRWITGQDQQAAGYGMGVQTQGDPITGELMDFGDWQYSHDDVPEATRQPMFLWAAIWIDAVGTFHVNGRLTRGIGS